MQQGFSAVDIRFALDVIADHFGVEPGEVSESSSFKGDLGADSLDLVELTMRLEDEFQVHIDDVEGEDCTSVGAALDLLRRKLQLKAAA